MSKEDLKILMQIIIEFLILSLFYIVLPIFAILYIVSLFR